jgi:drug/metabolite transporter (DMT)-like permease
MRPTDRTGLAIILSLVALTLFDAMGLIIKHLSDSYSAAELSAWRNLFGLVPSVIALASSKAWRSSGKRLKIRQWKLALMRGAIVTFAQLCFYMSLGLMAFATASTITYASALFTTALAIPLLGERVGWVRWSAVLIGFVGVILVVQPGSDSFSIYALLPLAASAFYALVSVTARPFGEPVFVLYSSNRGLPDCLFLDGFYAHRIDHRFALDRGYGRLWRNGRFVPDRQLSHDRTKQPRALQLLWNSARICAGLVVL